VANPRQQRQNRRATIGLFCTSGTPCSSLRFLFLDSLALPPCYTMAPMKTKSKKIAAQDRRPQEPFLMFGGEGMEGRLIRLKRIYNFLCSMLVYTPFALCFVYISWRFYAFSGTNLLTRCHSVSSYFLLFLCFRKVTKEIFSELDETKAEIPNYLTQRRSPKESQRRTKGRPHKVVARAIPRPCHQGV
jgi:hypothetical protein